MTGRLVSLSTRQPTKSVSSSPSSPFWSFCRGLWRQTSFTSFYWLWVSAPAINRGCSRALSLYDGSVAEISFIHCHWYGSRHAVMIYFTAQSGLWFGYDKSWFIHTGVNHSTCRVINPSHNAEVVGRWLSTTAISRQGPPVSIADHQTQEFTP